MEMSRGFLICRQCHPSSLGHRETSKDLWNAQTNLHDTAHRQQSHTRRAPFIYFNIVIFRDITSFALLDTTVLYFADSLRQ